jgi:hypothetical protein
LADASLAMSPPLQRAGRSHSITLSTPFASGRCSSLFAAQNDEPETDGLDPLRIGALFLTTMTEKVYIDENWSRPPPHRGAVPHVLLLAKLSSAPASLDPLRIGALFLT